MLLGLIFLVLWVAADVTPVRAQLTDYVDPMGYPAAWPSSWQTYTRLGSAQSDGEGNPDDSHNAAPSGSADFSSGSSGTETSIFYNGDGTVLFFRIRVSAPPLSLTGNGEPWDSATWNFLLDTDGDGYKEWVVMLDGEDSNSEPDDIVVLYENTATQVFDIDGDHVWRQDSAMGDTTTVDGESGGNGAWDLDTSSTRIWDWGRSRVVQIDTTLNPGHNNSEYFIDVQVPMSAFNASGLSPSGPTLSSSSPFTISATTSNSNTNPTQKDIIFPGSFTLGDAPVPSGDIVDGTGTIFQDPFFVLISDTLICPIDTIRVNVLDVLDVSGGIVVDTIDEVVFQYYLDYNENGSADDLGYSWTTIGNATEVAGVLGEWKYAWDMNQLANKQFLIRAIVTDDQGNMTTSTDQTSHQTAVVFNTCSSVPAYTASTKTIADPPDPLVPGGFLTYVLTIRNNGGGADTSVVVRDTLDTNLTFIAFTQNAGDTATVAGGVVEVSKTISTIGINDSLIVKFLVQVKNQTMANNTVIANEMCVISSKTADFCTSVSIVVTSLPSISLLKSVDNTEASPGDSLLYTLTYDNVGTADATLLVITDGSPDNTTYVDNSVVVNSVAKTDVADGDNVTVTVNGQSHDISVSIGTVIPSGSGTITFKAVVN